MVQTYTHTHPPALSKANLDDDGDDDGNEYSNFGTNRIFIVEDEVFIARELEITLSNLGYIVVGCALSALNALEEIPKQRPDLVLMDICLPGKIDGIEATRLITSTYDIPVIYLTAYPDPKIWLRAKKTKPFGYLTKPWSNEELVATIDIAINRHQTEMNTRQALELARQERQSIETSNQMYSHSLAMATHELRNFLSVVSNTSELLQSHQHHLSAEQQQRLLHNVQKAVYEIDHLLNDIVLLNHDNSSQIIVQPVTLDLISFCQELIESSQLTDSRRHVVRMHYAHPKLIVSLDRYLLGHIVRNLLSNALKYSPPGASIDIHLVRLPNYIQFTIEDRGMGIPDECLPNIFQIFQRASNVQTIEGRGIGLALVKRCVEIQGGGISVKSRLNYGTKFTVVLPQEAAIE